MKIHLATDHAGFTLKEEIKKFLQENGHKVTVYDNNSRGKLRRLNDVKGKFSFIISFVFNKLKIYINQPRLV